MRRNSYVRVRITPTACLMMATSCLRGRSFASNNRSISSACSRKCSSTVLSSRDFSAMRSPRAKPAPTTAASIPSQNKHSRIEYADSDLRARSRRGNDSHLALIVAHVPPVRQASFREPARRRGKRISRRGVADGRRVETSHRARGAHAFRCVSGYAARRVARDGSLQEACLTGGTDPRCGRQVRMVGGVGREHRYSKQ
jgi:hypothetical protein